MYNSFVMDKRPVGIFDSGLGGLTAVRRLSELMPNENIIYFGDTARCPYGTRQKQELREMVLDNLALLKSYDVRAIIAACGTMSANAGDIIKDCGLPSVNVIDPAVKVAQVAGCAPVLVIATEASIRTGVFGQKLRETMPGAEVFEAATQDFVRLCESGHTDIGDPELAFSVEGYLRPYKDKGIKSVILGCTHFAIIGDAIKAYFGEDIFYIPTGETAAEELCRQIGSDAPHEGGGNITYLTSGDTESFDKLASQLMGKRVKSEKVSI